MNYSQIKKLDEETLEKLTEGTGPSDQCLCSILAPPDGEKKGFRASIKKALASFGGRGGKNRAVYGQNSVDIPLTFSKGGKAK
ncbi:uncharacterized protein LOC114363194 [Ostrinia furnacalis]|uniref:uncharacterized protein LOC114363194 n=1 Tax=Ostrinia furnacalis TaxID=93504 RepID=UPI0010406987|nr:uncharacterized protein LOC114363194 [Ostrinia furnacalis]